MTPLKTELDRLKEICGKATGGPWEKDYHPGGICGAKCYHKAIVSNQDGDYVYVVRQPQITTKNRKQALANGDFIAQSRTALPKLIAALEVAVGALEKMKDVEAEEEPGVLSWEASTCRNALTEIEKILTEEK